MKKFGMFIAAIISALCIAGVVAVSANQGIPFGVYSLKSPASYSCNDIVFSETVNNPGAYADITDLRTKNVTTIDCSMTNWTNANYASNLTDSAIKLGGSKSGKYSGSVDLKLNGELTTNKVIIYATGWSGDTADLKVGVNGVEQDIEQTSGSYVFKAYTFELGAQTNQLTFTNNSAATRKSRTVISKIVFRLYGSSSGGDTPVDPTPIDPPAETTVTILPSDGTAVTSSDYSIEKDSIIVSVKASTLTAEQIRVFKGKTLNISSINYIKGIQFTCTTEGSTQYGPGCFSVNTGTYDYEGTIGTWSGDAKSITFTASLNQVRITQIVVTL